jgi:hypothetical protein
MFKTYNVVESVWQMNLFATLQVCRNLSNLDYLTAAISSDEEEADPEEPLELTEDRLPHH